MAGENVAGGGGRFLVPVTEDRVLYNEALRAYRSLPDIVPMQSSLRSEVILGTSKTIEFAIRSDQPNPGMPSIRSSENRLDLNDGFFVTDISVQVGIELKTSTTPGQLQFQTWPNPATLANGGFGANGAAMWELYNGLLNWQINTVTYGDGVGMDQFLRIDTAQGGSTTTKPFNKPGDAFKRLTPAFNMVGKDKVKFIVALPDSTAFTSEATAQVVAVLMLRGLKIQNGAQYIVG